MQVVDLFGARLEFSQNTDIGLGHAVHVEFLYGLKKSCIFLVGRIDIFEYLVEILRVGRKILIKLRQVLLQDCQSAGHIVLHLRKQLTLHPVQELVLLPLVILGGVSVGEGTNYGK